MVDMNAEILSSSAIVVLTILAIAVYIIYGAGLGFYALFVIAAALMLYTWYRVSQTAPPQMPARKAMPQKKTAKGASGKRKRR